MAKIIKDNNGKVLRNSSKVYEITAAVDSNIVAGNIKKDVDILGVTGTFEGDVDGVNGFLSVESKTIATSASQTTNIVYNKKCGIYDENGKKWDTLEWHQRWVDNGYSAQGLSKPTGIWMNAFGLENIYLWPLSSYACYEATGTSRCSDGSTFLTAIWNSPPINSATATDRTVWPANQSGMIAHGTAGKYRSATWRSVNNGDGLDMVCLNTGETFTIPSRDVDKAAAFMKDNYEDYMWSYYQQCEFFRSLFAICSGIATNEADGATTTVEILNSSGQQAAVNEEMYFWIGGTNTGLLAKYNLSSIPNVSSNSTSGNLTQEKADSIYTKQKANGVNMNDTGVNSSDRPMLLPGMKGAEAIAVDGYWYIKTPYLCNTTTGANSTQNIQDAHAIYLCKYYGVSLQTEKRMLPYYLNLSTHITSLVGLVRNIEGMLDIPSVPFNVWLGTANRYDNGYIWAVNSLTGLVGNYLMTYGAMCIPCHSVTFK